MMAGESHIRPSFSFNHLDDSSFSLALYELSHGPLNFNSDRLESLLFNPFEQPKLSNSLSNHLNSGSNFTTCLPSSSYMVEDDLNRRVASVGDKAHFSQIHLNARSLPKNLDQLNLMVKYLNEPFSVIGVSETWLMIVLPNWLTMLDTILFLTTANQK